MERAQRRAKEDRGAKKVFPSDRIIRRKPLIWYSSLPPWKVILRLQRVLNRYRNSPNTKKLQRGWVELWKYKVPKWGILIKVKHYHKTGICTILLPFSHLLHTTDVEHRFLLLPPHNSWRNESDTQATVSVSVAVSVSDKMDFLAIK